MSVGILLLVSIWKRIILDIYFNIFFKFQLLIVIVFVFIGISLVNKTVTSPKNAFKKSSQNEVIPPKESDHCIEIPIKLENVTQKNEEYIFQIPRRMLNQID